MKNKKKIRKKNPVSPVKKIQSPLKNKFVGSPAKNMLSTSGSPQKLIDGFLKQEETAAQVILTLTAFSKAMSVYLDSPCSQMQLVFFTGFFTRCLSMYIYGVTIFVRLSVINFCVWNSRKQFRQLQILQAHQLCRLNSLVHLGHKHPT